MKRFFLCTFLGLSAFTISAQFDSASVLNAVKAGSEIALTVAPQQWVKGADNSVIVGIVVTAVSYIISLLHHRKAMKAIKENA